MAKPKHEDAPRALRKPKRKAHAAHHGGAWKVAYADFVTAMMALFMVLWLLTQADVKVRAQIAQYFRDPGVLPGGSVLSDETRAAHTREPKVVEKDVTLVTSSALKKNQEREERQRAEGEEQKRLEQQATAIEKAIERAAADDKLLQELRDQVVIQVTPAGLTIQVIDKQNGEKLLFDLSSSELKPPLVSLLSRIARVLGELPNPVLVGGHTDARPFPQGSTKTNWQLSFERADAARRVLEANGLWPGQVSRILAYADSDPFLPGDPLADENRRLSILAERGAVPAGAAAAPAAPGAAGGGGTAAGERHEPVVLPPDELPQRVAAARVGG